MKGHSERIPNKNLKNFNGKSLYHTILETLLSSKYIEMVAINTDSVQIKEDVNRSFRDQIILIDRPKEIQGDFVSMNDIIKYDLSVLKDYDFFIQTHSTNPLLTLDTLNKAIDKFFIQHKQSFDSLFSVTKRQTRFYWSDGDPVNHNPEELLRTQDLPIIYEENSNFYLFSRDSFLNNNNNRIGRKPFLFEIDKTEAVDIDDPEDFIIAEQLYKLKNYE